jgi:predicted RNase H-like HicB family nuclease
MRLVIEIEREGDGRWLADIPALPGVMAYGATHAEAIAKVKVLALRVIADEIEHGERTPEVADPIFAVAA